MGNFFEISYVAQKPIQFDANTPVTLDLINERCHKLTEWTNAIKASHTDELYERVDNGPGNYNDKQELLGFTDDYAIFYADTEWMCEQLGMLLHTVEIGNWNKLPRTDRRFEYVACGYNERRQLRKRYSKPTTRNSDTNSSNSVANDRLARAAQETIGELEMDALLLSHDTNIEAIRCTRLDGSTYLTTRPRVLVRK